MTEPRVVTVYTDYKSPYAYLAKDLVYGLERDLPVHIDWRPYVPLTQSGVPPGPASGAPS